MITTVEQDEAIIAFSDAAAALDDVFEFSGILSQAVTTIADSMVKAAGFEP